MTDEFAVDRLRLARPTFGKAAIARQIDPGSDKIPQILSARMLERLPSLAIEPATVLDIGTPLAARQQQLMQSFPKAVHLRAAWHEQQLSRTAKTSDQTSSSALADAAVLRPGIAHRLGRLAANLGEILPTALQSLPGKRRPRNGFSADPCNLPLADASVDLVLACQVLPWCGEPGALFREIFRVLRPGGAFFWSSAGPDTLREYRSLWAALDSYPHVFGLHDMHDLGDDMLGSGFDSPVMDRENLTINYESMASLVADLRASGAVGLAAGRRRGLLAPSVVTSLQAATDNGLAVTIEHIQGHGWKTNEAAASKVGQNSGEVRIPVSAIGRGASR